MVCGKEDVTIKKRISIFQRKTESWSRQFGEKILYEPDETSLLHVQGAGHLQGSTYHAL
jgi:hypothetical protein